MKGWDVFKDPKWLMDNLFRKYKLFRIPTNAGWTSSLVGSGGYVYGVAQLATYTGTTANSRGMVYAYVYELNSGDITHSYIDWTKRLELEFNLTRLNSDAEAVARVQLKEANTEGALAQRGIGIEIQNFTMYGEGYGTARGTVAIGTLTNGRLARVKIVKTDSAVQFWVNGVLAGTLTGTAVPNVRGTVPYIVVSVINGATGGVSAIIYAGNIIIVQTW
jgi:hypothetical protein